MPPPAFPRPLPKPQSDALVADPQGGVPRLLEIIYEINERFLSEVAKLHPGDNDLRRRVSLVEEGDQPHIRMAYLSIVGSFSDNGVAALHTERHLLGEHRRRRRRAAAGLRVGLARPRP